MPIEKRAISVGDIPVAMRPDDLYQLEGISLLSCLIHQSNQLLEILVIIIRRVDLIDPGFNTGYLIILLRQGPPGRVILSLLHEYFDLLHLASSLDGVLDFFFVVICYFLYDGELVVYLLADGLPEVAEGFQKHCGRVKIILIIKGRNGRGKGNGGAWIMGLKKDDMGKEFDMIFNDGHKRIFVLYSSRFPNFHWNSKPNYFLLTHLFMHSPLYFYNM